MNKIFLVSRKFTDGGQISLLVSAKDESEAKERLKLINDTHLMAAFFDINSKWVFEKSFFSSSFVANVYIEG